MSSVIVYRSFLGATRQYAEWLAASIKADIYNFKDISGEKLGRYNTIVVASGTYIGWMPLVRYLIQNWKQIENKNVIVLAVGLVSEENAASKAAYNKIPGYIRAKIRYFKLPGKVDPVSSSSIKEENLDRVIEYVKSISK